MTESELIKDDFLLKIDEIIENNISNESFGVSELASEIGMSRSNLLRKIQKLANVSVSIYIRQIRLLHAFNMLKESNYTISEVSYKVGFGSTSYFIKCFKEQYGHPPGEIDKIKISSNTTSKTQSNKRKLFITLISLTFILMISAVSVKFIFNKPQTSEKSIAVLPFINDSSDSTNIYLINGLMESILNNLQQIEDLRVISRTSVEKYRNTYKSIPEIAKELNVAYFVEGSGQKYNDQILLNVQLIEADSDKHLWAQQYQKSTDDIFELQTEVAKSIAGEIKAIITPDEIKRISKAPTENIEAYDFYLKGLDLMYQFNTEGWLTAIPYYHEAISLDNNFAHAYAGVASCYYFLDMLSAKKLYTDSIQFYSEKAYLIDPKLTQSLIAKSLYYMNIGQNSRAVPFLEKALEYNPNSSIVISILADYYATKNPNTEKYLEYALKLMELDKGSLDSISISINYLHISNAFIQNGFLDEAKENINLSLDYDPLNIYSNYVNAYILLSYDLDFERTKNMLLKTLELDKTRFDVIQEVAKISYMQKDYEEAWKYYENFIAIRDYLKSDFYPGENAKIAFVAEKLGKTEVAANYLNKFKTFADNDMSIYKNLSLSAYYAINNDIEESIRFFKLFSKEENYFYWIVLFLRHDPIIEKIKHHPEFEPTMKLIEDKFWNNHKRLKKKLTEKEII